MLTIDFFRQGVQKFPNRTHVTDGTTSYTYAESDALSDRLAKALLSAGVGADANVAILSPNHPHVLHCQYAILKAGAVWVPLNFRNVAAENLRQVVRYDIRWLFYHSALADQAKELAAKSSALLGSTCIDRDIDGEPMFESWGSTEGHRELPARTVDDPIAIFSSGGTTGEPKGIVQTGRAFEAMVASFYATMRFSKPPVHLIIAPLTHAAGVFHWALLPLGATHVIQHSADPGDILSALEKHKASVIFLPPTLIYMLLAHERLREHDYSALEYFAYGAAPMSVDKLREAVAAFGPVMMQLYGQTECIMASTVLTREDHVELLSDPSLFRRIASAGRDGPFCKTEIMSDDGTILAAGERGEIVCRSQLLMKEYYKDAVASAATRPDGWHHTGDIGFKDEDGFVYIVDRKRDLIISGGFNIFPSEVEQVVMSHPAVQDCAVIGVPDVKWGEAVMAAVEVKPGATFDADDLIAFCRSNLGGVKAPKSIAVVDQLPRSTVGKVLRREVREQCWRDHARKI